MTTSLLRRPFDLAICLFYGIQLPMAVLMDSQSVFPGAWYPKIFSEWNDWYVQQYGDPMVGEKPAWFRGCILFELFVQAPFWAVATYAYAKNKPWIRLPNLIFSLCSLTMMVPIASELLLTDKRFDKKGVLQIYAPFAIVPFLIALKTALFDSLHPSRGHAKAL